MWVRVSLVLRHIDQIASLLLSAGYFLTAAPLISGFVLNLVQVSFRRKIVYQDFSGHLCEMFVNVSY